MTVTKWLLTNPADATSHTFELNPTPDTGSGDISRERPIINSYVDNSGPMVSLGQPTNLSSQFQVITLTDTEHTALWAWYDKAVKLTLTDDISRTMTVFMTSFKVKRSHKVSHPFYRQVTVDFMILDLVEA